RSERIDAQQNGATQAQIDRLLVRERSLAVAARRLRHSLGLPETFDDDDERLRLKLDRPEPVSARGRRRLRRAAVEPLWPERQRVKPVPTSSTPQAPLRPADGDAAIELVANAARYFGRRAADHVLDE